MSPLKQEMKLQSTTFNGPRRRPQTITTRPRSRPQTVAKTRALSNPKTKQAVSENTAHPHWLHLGVASLRLSVGLPQGIAPLLLNKPEAFMASPSATPQRSPSPRSGGRPRPLDFLPPSPKRSSVRLGVEHPTATPPKRHFHGPKWKINQVGRISYL